MNKQNSIEDFFGKSSEGYGEKEDKKELNMYEKILAEEGNLYTLPNGERIYLDPEVEKQTGQQRFKQVFYTYSESKNVWYYSGFNREECTRVFRDELHIVLRSKVRDPYMLNLKNNCYESVTIEKLQALINEDMGEIMVTTPQQIKKSLDGITTYVTPAKDVISFKNCQYDLEHSRVLEGELKTPKLCLVNIPYDYRYDTQPKYIKKFLETSLEDVTPEVTRKKMQGLFEIVAYLLTTGNPLNKIFFLTGQQGSGKSVLAKILGLIVDRKVSNVSLQEMSSNRFAFSQYVNSNINIITDSSNGLIKDNGPIKSASGDDDIVVEKKGEDTFILPADQVPKTIVMCNDMPIFQNPEAAVMSRLIILEFKKTFRDTEEQIPDLFEKIKNSPEDIEWFIYTCLEAYENMQLSKFNFTLQEKTADATRLLYSKHSDPLAWCVENLFSAYEEPEPDDYGTLRSDYCVINQDLNKVVVEFAKGEGVNIPLGKNGKITGRRLTNAIKRALDIEDENFGTQRRRFDGILRRVYLGLVPTQKCDELLGPIILREE